MTRLGLNALAAVGSFFLVSSPDWAQTQTRPPEFEAFQTRSLDLSAVSESLRLERFDIVWPGQAEKSRRPILGHASSAAGAEVRTEVPHPKKDHSAVRADSDQAGDYPRA
jgi:hypothetical protein